MTGHASASNTSWLPLTAAACIDVPVLQPHRHDPEHSWGFGVSSKLSKAAVILQIQANAPEISTGQQQAACAMLTGVQYFRYFSKISLSGLLQGQP